jgi:arylsulfatase
MGYSDPGYMGGDINTPSLDKMAAEGILFTGFFNHAKCEPTRASLLTGVHFHRQTHDHVLRNFRGVTTVAEELRKSGYHTVCTGKWHLPGQPTGHGFDHYFGLLGGAGSMLDPNGRLHLEDTYYHHKNVMLDGELYPREGEPFYDTEAVTDYAIRFLADNQEDKPFFLYLAYRAPHWPLQAPEEDIKKYAHRYDDGWDVLRERRFENMVRNGIADESWSLSARDPEVPEWKAWEGKEDASRCMEVHAAMVEGMDYQIGRLLAWLESIGKLDNTLILFASDNGVSAETNFNRTPDKLAGPVDSFRQLPRGFSNACNTPLQKYKTWNSNGGICSTLVAFWPDGIKKARIERRPVNILDMMPTFLELAKAPYPEEKRRLDGISLVPMLTGKGAEVPLPPQFFQLKYGSEVDQKAVLSWPWKAWYDGEEKWKLFRLDEDYSEANDISAKHPGPLQRLIDLYEDFDAEAQSDQVLYKQAHR